MDSFGVFLLMSWVTYQPIMVQLWTTIVHYWLHNIELADQKKYVITDNGMKCKITPTPRQPNAKSGILSTINRTISQSELMAMDSRNSKCDNHLSSKSTQPSQMTQTHTLEDVHRDCFDCSAAFLLGMLTSCSGRCGFDVTGSKYS